MWENAHKCADLIHWSLCIVSGDRKLERGYMQLVSGYW